MLLFIPALALDLLWSRTRDWNLWKKAAVSGLLFLGVLIAVQWPFSDFLQFARARRTGSSTRTSSITTRARLPSLSRHVFVKPGRALRLLDARLPGRGLGHLDHPAGIRLGRLDAACSPVTADAPIR